MMTKVLPFLHWLPRYRRDDLRGDLTAGLTVAVMLIPQGMAYALLAGLPPIVGLYASVVPLLVYALFGTSRQLAVGPVAMVSLLVATGVGKLAEPGTATYVTLAVVLAGMVGLIQFGMGVTRLGFLVNFLSHPVISGFTSAAALIIGFSQLKHLLGIAIPRSHHVHVILWNAVQRIGETNLPTLLIGGGSILLLLALKRWKPVFPGALVVVVLGTLLVGVLHLESAGVRIVGKVPQGLSSPSLPDVSLDSLRALLPIAVAISLVGFMESIAVAKAFATKNRYTVDANQELVALGVANVAASLFGAYPVTGGFSRTAVNAQAGARTGLASIITAAAIAFTLLFLTSLFHYLPTAVLAAIIMVAVFGLVDLKEVGHLYRVKRSDLGLLGFAFFATLFLGIEYGILLSVVASLALVIRRTTRPHCAILGRLPGTEIYRNIERYPEAITVDGLVILRMDVSLYFANVAYLKERIEQIVAESKKPLRAILFDASAVNDLDSSADTALHEIVEDLRSRGIELYFANVKGPVRDVLERSGFYARLGADHFFYRVHDAVRHFQGQKSVRTEGAAPALKKVSVAAEASTG